VQTQQATLQTEFTVQIKKSENSDQNYKSNNIYTLVDNQQFKTLSCTNNDQQPRDIVDAECHDNPSQPRGTRTNDRDTR